MELLKGRMHGFYWAILAAGATVFGIAIEPALAAPNQTPRVIHASHEDCKIIAEVGKAKAAWGPNGPNEPFAIDGIRPDGSIYREDCPWKALGVGNPTAATGKPGTSAFGVDRPSYSPDHKTATAALDFVVIAQKEGNPPFTSVLTCRLDMVGGRWKLRDFRPDLIT